MGETPKKYDFLNGEVLLFDKELDWTSFDLVGRVRNRLCRAMEIKKLKVGHAGTLDPKATGLMILCTGKSTKLIEGFQAGEKEYIATIKLGATTPSFDLETEEDEQFETSHINEELVQEALIEFQGEIDQVPPIYSALKVGGRRAYKHARKGVDVKMKSRKVTIREIELLQFSSTELVVRIVCSKGTYIRSVARDIGKSLNSGGYLVGLRRTRIGDFRIEDAFSADFFMENINDFVTN